MQLRNVSVAGYKFKSVAMSQYKFLEQVIISNRTKLARLLLRGSKTEEIKFQRLIARQSASAAVVSVFEDWKREK